MLSAASACCRGLLLLALLGACDDNADREDGAVACDPGARRDCDCDADHHGSQRCRGDGLAFLDCDCASSAGGGGGGGSNAVAGSAGTAGAGQCVDAGEPCSSSGECCDFPSGVCVDTGEEPKCAPTCLNSAACESGCCAVLDDYTGACADVEVCGSHDGCREDGVSCDESGDCCGFDADAPSSYCLELDRGGPGICSPRCDDASDCESRCCLALENGDSACFPTEDCS